MPRLIISERGKDREQTREWSVGDRLSIGRDPNNTISLSSSGVSRQHAELFSEDDQIFVVDLESGNGTAVNGRALRPHEKALLRPGDVITIDTFDMRFVTNGTDPRIVLEEEVTESDVLEVKLLKKVLSALDRETAPSLEVLNGSEEGKKIILESDVTELVVGRDPTSGFPIAEHVISRQHAKIMNRWGGIAVRDLESKNGTFVNNRRIVEEFLHDGDRISLGTIVLMFRNPQEVNVEQFTPPAPRYRPAKVAPQEIPLTEDKKEPETPPLPQETSLPEEPHDFLEQSHPMIYPAPTAPQGIFKGLMPVEIGLIGLGASILLFALITLVNLLFS